MSKALSEGINLDLLSPGQRRWGILLPDALDSDVGEGASHVFVGDLHAATKLKNFKLLINGG